jgi:phosphoserine phosphatase
MKTRLVVFDMDGVLVDTISTWVWVHQHFGVNNDLALKLFLEKKIDDMEFMRRDIALWLSKNPSLCLADIKKITDTVPLMPGTTETIETLAKRGIESAVVTGGLDLVAKRIAGVARIKYVISNGLETDGCGNLTGKGVCNVELLNKAKPLRELMQKIGVKRKEVVAVGNSQIDVPMFKVANFGIAFNPADEIVQREAKFVVKEKNLLAILKYVGNGYD